MGTHNGGRAMSEDWGNQFFDDLKKEKVESFSLTDNCQLGVL